MSETADWRLRQRHHEDVTKVLKDGGEMDSSGRLRKWFGRQSLSRLVAANHTAVGYEQCSCRRTEPEAQS